VAEAGGKGLGVRPEVWLVGLGNLGVSLVWQMYDAYLPIFFQAGRPDFSEGVGVAGYALSPGVTGLLMALDNVVAFFILPVIGAYSDGLRTRFGRRVPFVAVGAPLAALSFLLIPYAVGKPLIVLLGAVMCFLLAMDLFRVPLLALMPDLTPPARRSQGSAVLTLLYNLGFVLGAAVGGQLFKKSPAHAFLFGAVGLLVTSLILALCVREPRERRDESGEDHAREETPPLPELLRGLASEARRDPSLRWMLTALFVWNLGVSALATFFTSYVVNVYRVDTGSASTLLAFFGMSGLVGALPAGLLGARFGRRRMLLIGLTILPFLLLFLNVAGNLTNLRLLLVGMGLAYALISVNAAPMVMDMVPPDRGGSATGLLFLSAQASAVFGPVFAGLVLDLAGRDYRALSFHIPAMFLFGLLCVRKVRGGEGR
jgi:maltose/moltooligosaccharide transporter